MKRKPSAQLSSSSSEEDEDATSEEEAQSKEDVKEQQPKQVQEDEESEEEEEEESSDDEEKGEEDEEEEEEDGEDDNEKVIDLSSPRSSQFKIAVRETASEKPKSPPVKQKQAVVKPPAKSVESKPLTTDTKKPKPAVSSPLRIPPSSPPQKRAVNVKEANDKEANGSKKRKVGDAKPDQNSPAVVSVDNDQKRRRVWDDENEIRLLRTFLEHLQKGVNDNEIYDDVLKVLGGSFNKRQLREKMRSFKVKHEAVKEKAKGKPVFKTAHEEEIYEFGEKIWGDKEDSELKEHESLQEHTSNEKTSANSIGKGNNNEKPNAKISGVERSSSKSKVDNGEPDSKLRKSSVADMEIDVNPNHLKNSSPNGDNHVLDGKKDVKGNQNSVLNQAAIKDSAQILENGDFQGDSCEYEMVESGKLYMKTDDLVKEGLSIAVKSGNLEFQQELRELDRMKKELKVLQLEIILRQVKLAQAAIGAQK